MHYLLIFPVSAFLLLSASAANNRRLLHQPFFALDQTPVISQPPSSAPPPQPQQTKYPFSSPGPTSDIPFFPEDSPPPPLPFPPPGSPTAFATFPANVSSLVLPSPSHPSRKTTKLVSLIVLVSLFSIFIFASLFVLLLRHRRRRDHDHDDQSLKADSLRLFPPNTPTSDTIPAADTSKKPPPPLYPCHTPSSTSSEFLHLGTLVRSGDLDRVLSTAAQNAANALAPPTNYRTLGSPELLPLPPLPRQPSGQIHHHTLRPQVNEEDDGDEFFSPRGSTANNATPHRTGSSHPHSINKNGNGFTNIGISNSSDCNSSLYSISPDNTPSVALNSDSSVVFPAPLPRFMPPPPARQPRTFSPFSPSSTEDGGTHDCSPRSSDFSAVGRTTPPLQPPPLRNGPPELVGPSRNVDKVRASSERTMVWDQLKSSPFQLNEERIETPFTVNSSNLNEKEGLSQENLVLDPKKSQDIALLLRARNVTTAEVCEALVEGNAEALGTDLLESLLSMAPTIEEERKLMELKDGQTQLKLGPTEAFLKAILNVPFAFRRIEAMLYVVNFESEIKHLNRSFDTIESACEELKSSRMFLKLLEAVLMIGNRSDTHAFKIDTLLKLADSKGADGKSTLLHFVVQEITNAEGLHVVSGLSGELMNVKKAADMDSKLLTNDVSKLVDGIGKIKESLKLGHSKFSDKMSEFMKNAEGEIGDVKVREGMIFSAVKNLTEYFHGELGKEEAHSLRLFVVVQEFLSVLDSVCKEVRMKSEGNVMTSGQQAGNVGSVFPGFMEGQESGSSDDESSSSF